MAAAHQKTSIIIRKWSWLWLVLALVVFFWPAGTLAQDNPGWPSGVQIESNQATASFPNGITFKFQAKAEPGSPVFKRLDLAYKLEGDVETSLRHQTLSDGAAIQANFDIDTHSDYIPPGTRITYYWLLLDQQGQSYQTAVQTLTYNDTRYNFKELKQGLLTVRWSQGSQSFGQAMLKKAQATVDKLSQLYKVKPDTPINITIYPDSRTMFTALPPNTQEWVGGQAIPQLGTIVLAIAPDDLKEVGRSIPHEVSHQVVYQATRNPYNVPPKWLDEGLAVSNQDQVDGFLQQAYEQGRADRTLFSLRSLDGVFPTNSQDSFRAYGQSVQVVQYIIKHYGEGALQKMLAAFKEGHSYDEIVQAGTGLNLDGLDREWKQSIGYPVNAPLPTPTLAPAINLPTPGPSTTQPVPTATGETTPTPAPTLELQPALATPTAVSATAVAAVIPTAAPRPAPPAQLKNDDGNTWNGLLVGAGLGSAALAGLGLLLLVNLRRKGGR